ncbi:MAG: hypothetical protein IT539_04790 [Bradyrhizobiaceae bacterium]|nr:hypothetical protein [Bradyrhizobiaceae bacterium]
MKARLADLWNGRVPLSRVFWEYAVIFGSIANLIIAFASLFALSQRWSAVGVVLFVLPIPYNLLMIVAVWRSAARYEGPQIWATLARALIIVWAVVASLI